MYNYFNVVCVCSGHNKLLGNTLLFELCWGVGFRALVVVVYSSAAILMTRLQR